MLGKEGMLRKGKSHFLSKRGEVEYDTVSNPTYNHVGAVASVPLKPF